LRSRADNSRGSQTFTVRWNTPTDPFRIIGNIYYVGTNGLAVYLITSPQGHILIDTALPEATPQIKSSIEKLGFKVADVKYLLNTHAHLDHTGGFAELKKDTGAQLHRRRRRQAVARGRLLSRRGADRRAQISSGQGRPDRRRRRHRHARKHDDHRPRDPRPLAWLARPGR